MLRTLLLCDVTVDAVFHTYKFQNDIENLTRLLVLYSPGIFVTAIIIIIIIIIIADSAIITKE